MSSHSVETTNPTLIMVLGTSRSGSTMLDVMLGNASDAFSCGEVSAWFRPFRTEHFQIDCLCSQNPCPVWAKVKDVLEGNFHAAVIKGLNVNYVIDSSKDICWCIDAQRWASRSGMRIVNIVIWKDPIELAYSYWKRGRKASSWRKSFVSAYGRIIQVKLPFLSVRYSKMASDPARSLEKLCNVIGMPYFQGKERFWEKRQHHLFGSDGIRLQIAAGKSSIVLKNTYPDEFDEYRTHLQKQIDQDGEIQHIIQALTDADALHDGGNLNQNNVLTASLPLWYYRKRLIRWFRRYIPEPYKNNTVNVETIPLNHSG